MVSAITDLFPNDAAESSDTDGDGVGNNADIDDDSDGFSDLLEETYGSIATSSMSRLAMTQKGESLFGGETGVRSGKIALNGAGIVLAIGSPGDRGATDTITQGRVQVYQYEVVLGQSWGPNYPMVWLIQILESVSRSIRLAIFSQSGRATPMGAR